VAARAPRRLGRHRAPPAADRVMDGAAAQLELERLRGSALPRIVFVTHGAAGGVARHIHELTQSIAGAAEVIVLQPAPGGCAALRLPGSAPLTLHFALDSEWDSMLAVLRAIGVARVHFHHVHGWPQRVLDLTHELDAPYIVTLHDYYPACAGYHLTDGYGRYCGAPPDCERCTDGRTPQWPLDAHGWRAAFAPFLAAAERVIAPSNDCAATLQRFFPQVHPSVWPHPENPPTEHPIPRRVLVPGGISREKGLDILASCAGDARDRGLPLYFRILGHVAEPLETFPTLPLTISGEYPEGTLPQLFDRERGDVVFFPTQVPETFSYTLSAAMDTGLPIVATNLGALPERLARHPSHRIVAWDADPATLNAALLAVAKEPPQRPLNVRPLAAFAAYRTRYLEGLRAAGTAGAMPAIEPRWLQEPQRPTAPWTFYGLVEEALGRGRAIPLEAIRLRAAEADSRLEAADSAAQDARGRKEELDQWHRESEAYFASLQREAAEDVARSRAAEQAARTEIAKLDGALAQATGELALIHRSLSWRVTAPLRALKRKLRG
jgi:glycosyltransferase involved in cell wall biosynthesis